jgi:putative DNA methylase
MVPLVTSFMLSTKENRKAWVESVLDPAAPDGYQFEVRTGALSPADEKRLEKGTKTGRGTFTCLVTGSPVSSAYIKAEARIGQLGQRLMAVVYETARGRSYLMPSIEHEIAAKIQRPDIREVAQAIANDPRALTPILYDLDRFDKLFTARQLLALSTFSDLVGDAEGAGRGADGTALHAGGTNAAAYADAVATYLAFAVDKASDRNTTLCGWETKMDRMRNTFGRQALPMIWDYAETNPLAGAGGDIEGTAVAVFEVLSNLHFTTAGHVSNIDAAKNSFPVRPIVISTDPPYYDNIGYADLSDFFYVWLKRSLGRIWPDLFRRLTTPKADELVALPYRHGGRNQAEAFFMKGMSKALTAMRVAATDGEPLAIYYAFKQSELAAEGIISAGWASFLDAVIQAGLAVDGTWPIRTELANRMRGQESNALASSIVLVCRKRGEAAHTVTRAEFIRTLKRDMPAAVDKIRKAGVGPVDMPQSIIGPGMGVFTRFARVLEDDDSAMGVKTALALINRVWGEIENDLDANFDPETQVALAWFAEYGFEARASGDLITLANAKNIPSNALFSSGVFQNLHGKASLTPRAALPGDWSPATDKTPTVWECVQHTARVLAAEDGGAEAAAKLVAAMGSRAEDARALAYRLYEIASQKSWAAEALVYNELAQEWAHLDMLAADVIGGKRAAAPERDLFGEVAP